MKISKELLFVWKQALPDTVSAVSLILDFMVSRTVKNHLCCLQAAQSTVLVVVGQIE